jgi:hypothetical protein
MDNILAPLSPGELLDKISILEIKSERMTDVDKLVHVRAELALLRAVWDRSVPDDEALPALYAQLLEVNQELWEIEDAIRARERAGEFDAGFIELARSVYFTNDRRAQIKQELNHLLGSGIVEEKSYQKY